MSAPTEPLDWVRLLTDETGPRRPTSAAEARAGASLAGRLDGAGAAIRIDRFRGYSTFAATYGTAIAIALLAPALGRRRSAPLRAALAAVGPALAAAEDGLRLRPLSRLLSRRWSQNVVATADSRGEQRRTVCLVCHLDSSRSGLIFHPRALPWLHRVIALQGAAMGVSAAGPLLERSRPGRALLRVARLVLLAVLGLLGERELRGVDVPGANDNASGVAAVATLACELAVAPLGSTRVVCLFTGCEESGLRGAEAFLDRLGGEAADWIFINFDGVGAPAPLRFLRREGALRKWDADPRLVALAERVARKRPDLGLEGSDHNAGLTYDVTPVLARGGRAITISAQGETIPNYHSPTDTVENLDADVLSRAIEVGREMLAAVDRGEADA